MNEYRIRSKIGLEIVAEDSITGNVEQIILADDIGDKYHMLSELYEHRHALFCALCKIYDNYITPFNTRVHCWKSKLHSDGTMFEGHFIAGMTITQFRGRVKYITYHLPLSWWDKFNLIVMERAPEWDGHTSDDVIKLLGEL